MSTRWGGSNAVRQSDRASRRAALPDGDLPGTAPEGATDFTICPHCWHLNPASRICARCFADTRTVLQESGGRRLTAPAQSPMPVRGARALSGAQRLLLLGALVLFGISQVAVAVAAFTRGGSVRSAPPAVEAGSRAAP